MDIAVYISPTLKGLQLNKFLLSWWHPWAYFVKTIDTRKRLNSSRPPLLWKCLAPRITVIGRPFLSDPCRNILFCATSFGVSNREIEPCGTNSLLHFRYLRSMEEPFHISKPRARRNRQVIYFMVSERIPNFFWIVFFFSSFWFQKPEINCYSKCLSP